MSSHTPGPWAVSSRTDGNWWHIGAGNQAIAAVHAASKKRNEPYAGMFEANAHLIAAAPDLLEELVITLGALKEVCDVRHAPLPESTIRRAEAAIAKAKGTTR